MAEIIWTQPAIDNLEEIAEYIAISNPIAARQVVASVLSAVERLEIHPDSGRIPPEIENLNYREAVVNPCRVFYKLDANKLFILFVMRQERDLKKFLLDNKSDA